MASGSSHSHDVPSLLAIPDIPIHGYGRVAHELRWAAAQTCLGISSPLLRFAPVLIFLVC